MRRFFAVAFVIHAALALPGLAQTESSPAAAAPLADKANNEQVPTWSADDLAFFLHGSMSTEVVPETVLRAFIMTYPELFPKPDLTFLGLIPDPEFGWPIGFSRKEEVKHLGSLSAVGINCASCHVAQLSSGASSKPIRILGATSHFNVEAFFGAVIIATFKTSDPVNMKKFLAAYAQADPKYFEKVWKKDEAAIVAAIKADPFGSKGIAPGALHEIKGSNVHIDQYALEHGVNLSECAQTMLKLFHNMRAALHVPDKPPARPPPASGPGRNDAFGLLAASLLQMPQPYSPIKFGLVWNIDQRTWVHWDGNTKSPIARNLLASLGLGAPMNGKHGDLEFAEVKRQTDLSEVIRPPKYPFTVDSAASKRGGAHFAAKCISCHASPEGDKRLYAVTEVGTDPHRAEMFTQKLADGFNTFLAELESEGYEAPKEFGVRSTGKYYAATLSGVWARSPYLHNGSVRTMQELLTAPANRAKSFHRGSRTFDEKTMGYTDEGAYVFDTAGSGNSNSGHNYGTDLTSDQKHDLIEYLKTL